MRLRENATLITEPLGNESDYPEEHHSSLEDIELEADIAEWEEVQCDNYEIFNEPEDDPLGLGPLLDM